VFFVKTQLLWLMYTLKGGIVFGLFPATYTIIHLLLDIFFKQLETDELSGLSQQYSTIYARYFKKSLALGYTISAGLILIIVDLAISRLIIQNSVVHAFLGIILIICFGTSCYLFPSIYRYDLPAAAHIRQAFFLFMSSPAETVAMILGAIIATGLIVAVPVLGLLAAVPLYFLPICWFAFRAIKKIESGNERREQANEK